MVKSELISKWKTELILKYKLELILKYNLEFLVLEHKSAVVLEWVNSDMPSEARGVLFYEWVRPERSRAERRERTNS